MTAEIFDSIPSPPLHRYDPRMDGFTPLERHVFNALAASKAGGDKLLLLLGTAEVLKRTNTGVGFYTEFVVDQSLPPMDWVDRVVSTDDPLNILAQSKIVPMVFNLFLDAMRYPNILEGVHLGVVLVSGRPTDDSVDLRRDDLAALLPVPGDDPSVER